MAVVVLKCQGLAVKLKVGILQIDIGKPVPSYDGLPEVQNRVEAAVTLRDQKVLGEKPC